MSGDINRALKIRTAVPEDIEAIVHLTNRAYVVERPLIHGVRTEATEVGARMKEGRFLVAVTDDRKECLAGSVFVRTAKSRGYLGMLAVDPDLQGRGVAGALVRAVENECLREDCSFLDLTVLSLRRELFPFYRHFGFRPSAVLPYPRPELLLKPLHLVQMTKALRPDEEL